MDVTSLSRVWREPARLLVFLSALLGAGPAWALDVPPLTGRVVDLAHALSADAFTSLTHDLQAHETTTSNQVALLILPSLDGEPLEEFSHRVATNWKLGQKGTDNGVLLLIALRERKVRIEVGYGLEGMLTDLRSARIIRNEIVPHFRTGDLSGGITAGVRAILGTIEGTYIEGSYTATDAPAARIRASAQPSAFNSLVIAIVVGILAGVVLSHGLQRTRALFGSVLAFLVAQFSSLWIGLAAAGVTAVLLWLMLQANRGGGRGRHAGRGPDAIWGPGGFSGDTFGSGGGFSGGGGDFGGGGASGDW